MPRFYMAVHERRRRRELDGWLGDVIVGISLQFLREGLALGTARMRTDEHAIAPRLAHGLHHQLVQIGQHMGERLLFAAKKSLDAVEYRFFREVVANESRYIDIDRFVVGDPRAQRIGDEDIS